VLGLTEAVVDCLNAASALEPSAAEVWAKKAMAFASSGQRQKVDGCVEMAVSLDTSSFVTPISCARALSLLGRNSEAITLLDLALRKRPFSAHTWNYKGEAQLALSNFRQAERSFRKSIARDSNHIEPYRNLARLYAKIGKYDRAISFAKDALRIASNDCATLVILGDAYEATGRRKESIEVYKKAIDLGKDTIRVRKRLFKVSCTLYRASGGDLNKEFIRPLYASLLRKNRKDHSFLAGLQHLFRKRNFDPLILFFVDQELYSTLNQLNAGGRTTIADLLVEVERHSAEHRQIVGWRYSVGRLYYGLDMFDECLRIFSSSLEQNNCDEKALYYVAACHEIKGNFRAALDYYEKALKLDPGCPFNRSGRQRVLAGLRESQVGPKREQEAAAVVFPLGF
jgi:tetratricopeptide (TPR) repeat protein